MFPSTFEAIMSKVVVTVVNGLNEQYNPAPTIIPTRRDKFTSFVIKLTIIANIGGISDQKVADIITPLSFQDP